jgi:hypothetical protein
MRLYEVDGKEITLTDEDKTLAILSHHHNNLVVIWVGGKKYTASGADLKNAILNAMNTGR